MPLTNKASSSTTSIFIKLPHYSILIYVFYKIFVNGLATIKEFNNKKAFTIEEVVASVIIASVAIVALSKVFILGYSITEILILFMIMALGWKHGVLVGAITAISIGLSITFIEGLTVSQVLLFVVAGIISGLLGKIGKVCLMVVVFPIRLCKLLLLMKFVKTEKQNGLQYYIG